MFVCERDLSKIKAEIFEKFYLAKRKGMLKVMGRGVLVIKKISEKQKCREQLIVRP